jgi:hypothetical protein
MLRQILCAFAQHWPESFASFSLRSDVTRKTEAVRAAFDSLVEADC